MEVDYFRPGATKRCVFGSCKSDSRYSDVKFISFPKPCLAVRKNMLNGNAKHIKSCETCTKCRLFLARGKRKDYCKLEHVKKWHYICVMHFVNEEGPTNDNPFPLPEKEAFLRRVSTEDCLLMTDITI